MESTEKKISEQIYEDDDWKYDPCYECGGYGDDYSIDDNGDLVLNCNTCPFNANKKGDA